MGKKQIILFILGFGLLFGEKAISPNADDILIKVINRLKGIDRSMQIRSEFYKKDKLTEYQVLKLFVHWPINGEVEKMTHIEYEEPKKRKGVRFWEHSHKSAEKPFRWITLPVTGKLTDITGKKNRKKGFDISELQLKKSDIENHSNKVIGTKMIEGREAYIIECIEKKEQKKRDTKILTIDKEYFFIWEVITKNKKGKLVKSVSCGDLKFFNDIPVLTEIDVRLKKGKKNIKVKLDQINFEPEFDSQLFQPAGNS